MPRLLVRFLTILALLSGMPAKAAELPKAFLGNWTNNDSEIEVTGIYVGPRTYHEPGYNCDIKSITAKNDAATITRTLLFIIDMACVGDGENPGPARSVREIWALRKVSGKDVLVMTGTAGPTYPSIHILQRGE